MEAGAIILPLLAALGYALGSLVLKRAMAHRAGVIGLMLVGNWLTALVFIAIFGFEGMLNPEVGYFWALLGAAGFLVGQSFSVLAIKVGEVSVQTPLMGSKTVLVALMAAAIGLEKLALGQWLAVLLSLVAVFMISGGSLASLLRHRRTVLLVVTSCLGFGVTDIAVGRGAAAYGPEGFISFLVLCAALGSLPLLLLGRRSLRLPRPSWGWVAAGGALIAIQALSMNLAIAHYGKPTLTNVLYSTRGLLGVLLVWLVGHWFGNLEMRLATRRQRIERLAGAGLVLLSVILMLWA